MPAVRGVWEVLPHFLLVAMLGCATGFPEHIAPGWGAFRPLAEGLVSIEAAVVRAPLDDSYLCDTLWREVDEQTLPMEKRLALEANGLRTGVISGNVPAQLQRLLTSNDTCVRCRRIAVRTGHAYFFPLSGTEPRLVLRVIEDGQEELQEFEKAVCALLLRLDGARTGVRVSCQPCVQHGHAHRLPRPGQNREDWELQTEPSRRVYSSISWDFALTSADYGIIGHFSGRPDSFGFYAFCQETDGNTWQSILVLRMVPNLLEPGSLQAPCATDTDCRIGLN